MPVSSKSRRQYLKSAGVASTGLIGGFAGCTGSNSSGQGTTKGGGSGEEDLTILSVANGRTGTAAVVMQEIKNNNLDRKHGVLLDVNWMSISAAEQAIKNRQVECSFTSVIAAGRLNAQGGKLREIWPMFTNNESLVVSKDVDISTGSLKQTLEDMKGLTIATLPEYSTAHSALSVLLEKAGFDINDFDIRTGPPPVINAFLLDGEVDGMINVAPNGSKLIAGGDFKRVFTYHDAWQSVFGNSIAQIEYSAYQDTIDEKPGAIKGFMNAYFESSELVKSDLKKYLTDNMDLLGLENETQIDAVVDYANQIDWFKTKFPESLRQGDRQLLQHALDTGIIDKDINVDQIFVDPREL